MLAKYHAYLTRKNLEKKNKRDKEVKDETFELTQKFIKAVSGNSDYFNCLQDRWEFLFYRICSSLGYSKKVAKNLWFTVYYPIWEIETAEEGILIFKRELDYYSDRWSFQGLLKCHSLYKDILYKID